MSENAQEPVRVKKVRVRIKMGVKGKREEA